MEIFEHCPRQDQWQVPWDAIHDQYDWIRLLKGCPQNPRYHAEGDVWTHTRMVCEAMASLPVWRDLGETLRQDLFAAALLHDAAKPECTKVQANGRVTSRGHARRGGLLARRLLWQSGVPAERRERICGLVRHHMVPLYLRDSEHRNRQVMTISQTLRCDLLAILGLADAQGRICEDPADLTHRHEAFETICRELNCFERPYPFLSSSARFQYFHQLIEDPAAPVEQQGPEVILLSGLPGAGKKAWIEANLPEGYELIEVDTLRAAHRISWRDNQGAVISAARDRAKELLIHQQPFAWLDMNLGRQLRDHLIRLFAEHGARVRIVYLESEPEAVLERLDNPATRAADFKVLMDHWEPPEVLEAHELQVETEAAVSVSAESLAPEALTEMEPSFTTA